jgi:RimJ/RimL family protein N-acetyltransferase
VSSESALPLQPVLEGLTLQLRPLIDDDFEALYASASDPLIWIDHPSPLRYQRAVFQEWFEGALASCGTLVVLERATGKIIGSSRYYDWDESARQVAIGYTFLDRPYWGGAVNAELKRLMLNHAFQWAHTVWFHVAVSNVRSRKAMEKIGAKLSHRSIKKLTGGEHEYFLFRIDRADPWRFSSYQDPEENEAIIS